MFANNILLVGCFIGHSDSSTITISSLFKEFDYKCIFIASTEESIMKYASDETIIKLINLGNVWNLSKNIPFSFSKNVSVAPALANKGIIVKKIKKLVLKISDKIGIKEVILKKKGNESFYNWIRLNKIQLCYSTLSSYYLIREVWGIYKNTNVKFIIHFFDNWLDEFYYKQNKNIFIKAIGNNLTIRIFKIKALYYTISDAMAVHYKCKYNIDCNVFHHVVEIKTDDFIYKRSKNNIKIGYFGRVGRGNSIALGNFIQSLDIINAYPQKNNVFLHIYSFDKVNMKINEWTTIKESVKHEKILEVMRQYDLLLLPLDSDISNKLFIKYSIPTKLTDYAKAKVPVLSLGPEDIALNELINKKKLAYHIEDMNTVNIASRLNEILQNPENDKMYINNLQYYVLSECNPNEKRDQLSRSIANLIDKQDKLL